MTYRAITAGTVVHRLYAKTPIGVVFPLVKKAAADMGIKIYGPDDALTAAEAEKIEEAVLDHDDGSP